MGDWVSGRWCVGGSRSTLRNSLVQQLVVFQRTFSLHKLIRFGRRHHDDDVVLDHPHTLSFGMPRGTPGLLRPTHALPTTQP